LFDDLFKFVRPSEARQRERDFRAKIFPLGMGQRDLALAALRPLIKPKIHDEELLFTFITAKQKYIDDSEHIANIYLQRQKQFSDDERAHIMELIRLDISAKSLEEYPTATDL